MGTQITRMSLIATSALTMCWGMPALAQSSSEELRSGDIIVTARRVEERLQDVPISITVFNQEQLTNDNVASGRDLALYTPSLSVNSRYGNDFASFSIRGFTQESRTTASVGVYFADVVIPRSSGASAQSGDGAAPGSLFDLENVQVLKGPQGTLFGRNTTGGAIVLVPRRPTGEFGGYVEGSIGNYDMRRLQGVVNVPINEAIKVRAGVDWHDRKGFLRNESGVGPGLVADVEYIAARFSVLADLTPDLENYTVASYSKSTPNGILPKITDCFNGPNSLSCKQFERERGNSIYQVAGWLPWQRQQTEIWQVSNSTRWNVNDSLTIKNIVSYGETIQDQAMDLFGSFHRFGPTFSVGNVTVNVPSQFVGKYFGSSITISPAGLHAGAQNTFTEELQFIGTAADGRLRWQAGAYYERSKPLGWSGTQSMQGVICDSLAQWETYSCTDVTAAVGGQIPSNGSTINLAAASRPTGSRNRQVAKIDYRNIGLYAQASLDIAPWLTVDAGFRYTWDRTKGQGSILIPEYSAATNPPWAVPTLNCLVPGLVYAGTIESCAINLRQNSKAPTWLLGVNVKPLDDLLLYAKYVRGYRQGSINPLGALGFQTFEPEQVDVYEVGLKASFEGAISGNFNISGFYNDFKDMQLQVAFLDLNNIPPNLSPAASIVNAGKSRILGFEIEAGINPFEGMRLQVGYSYLDTKLQELAPISLAGQPVGGYNLVAALPMLGARLPYSPKTKLTVNATYRLPLADGVGRVTLGGTFVRTGSTYYGENSGDPTYATRTFSLFDPSSPFYDPRVHPAYNLVNFNLNWDKIFQSNFSSSVFVTNAFKEKYFANQQSSSSLGSILRYPGEPRMYGMRLKYDF